MPFNRGLVFRRHTALRRGRQLLAARILAVAFGVAGVAVAPLSLRLAFAEEAMPSAASEAVTAAHELTPLTGNAELIALIDQPGNLTIAGEQMHPSLLRRFYAAHEYQPVWDAHPTQAAQLRAAVLRAGEHGLDPGLFHGTTLGEHEAALPPVERDVLLSDALLSYADALSRGALPIEDRFDDEDLIPEPVDLVAVLDAAISDPDPARVIEALAPSSPEYMAMRQAYAEYRTIAAGPRVARTRADPVGSERTTATERRVRQLAVNLERLRWLPRRMPPDRLVVNAAIARLQLFHEDRPIFTTRVVVGEIDKQTPELQSTINDVLFNPPWNIPRSIAQKEILPKVAADPGYLTAHHMRFRANGSIQQEAGPYSALGRLKFEMGDRYDVYLHDTPEKSLFHSVARMMSHGCVRAENPRIMASLLLGLPPEAIDREIAGGHTHRRALSRPLPAFIVYQTAYVESGGSIQFGGDPYQRDDEIWQRLTQGHRLPMAQDSPPSQRKG